MFVCTGNVCETVEAPRPACEIQDAGTGHCVVMESAFHAQENNMAVVSVLTNEVVTVCILTSGCSGSSQMAAEPAEVAV